MNPLLPPTFTTLFITTLLVLVCHHMYRQERDRALLFWTWAWVAFFFRQLGALVSVYRPELDALHGANHILSLLFTYLLLRAAQQWSSVTSPRYWNLIFAACAGWTVLSEVLAWPHLAASIPASFLSAFAALWAGLTMLRSPRRQGNRGATLTSWALVAWAFHALDHPLSWELEWYLPWDYELDAALALFTAVAIWLLYYGESRQSFDAGQASYASLVSSLPTLFWKIEGARPREVFHTPPRVIHERWAGAGSDWAESIHPDDFLRVTGTCRTAIEKREPFSLEYRLRSGEGEYRWVKDDGAPVFDASGQYTGFVGAATDITSQKENEARLIERERHLHVLFEESADAIFVAGRGGKLVQVNEQACLSTGYSREELLTMHVADIDTRTLTISEFERFSERLNETKTQLLQTEHRRKDGSVFPVEVRVTSINTDQGPLIFGAARDLSERVESEVRYAKILEAAIDGFWVVNSEGRIIETNQAAANALGYSVDEMLQLAVYEIDVDEDPEDSGRRIEVIAAQGHLRFEARHRCKDGRIIDADVSVSSHPTLGGHMFVFTRDITERKQAELALKRSESFLKRSQSVGHIGSWEFDLATGEVTCSDEFCRIFQYETSGVRVSARQIFQCIHPEDWYGARKAYVRSLSGREGLYATEFRIVRPGDGDVRVVESRYEHERDGRGRVFRSLGVVQDITERKRQENVSAARLRLIEFASQGHSSHELLQTFLDEAEKLTDSLIGFFHFVDPDQENLSLQAWSTNTLAHMCTAEGEGLHYPISQAGVWVDCVREGKPVIHNDYANLAHRKGLPEGHSPIIRQLVVPVFRAGQVVAILGVGNKPTNYGEYDCDMIVQLADIAWDTVVRMRAEEALQTSEAKFSKAFWNAPFLMTLTALEDGRCLEANDAFYELTGFTPDQVLGKDGMELGLITPAVRDTLAELFDRDGHARDVEVELNRTDGSSMTALYSGVLVEVDGVQRVLSTAVDITERKRAEHKLAHAYELLERSNEAARIGSWEIDLATLEITWSRVACEIFGLFPETKVTIDQWLSFYVHEEHFPEAVGSVGDVLSWGQAFDFESTVFTAMGDERFVRTNGLPVMEDGRCVKMYGLFQDLTERRTSEIALQRQHRAIGLTKNMTTVFLTSSPDNVFTDLLDVVKKATESHFGLFGYIDDNGNLTCPALSQLLWGSSEYADGKAVFRPEQWGGIWGKALRNSTTCLLNEKLQVPEGHLSLDNAIATPLVHQGRAIGLFVLANRVGGYGGDEVDLLESAALQTAPVLNAYLERIRKEDEHERLEAQFRQAQKMEAIGQLTGGVAHDFNNLLQIIIGYSDILLLHNITPEQSRDLLEQIASAGHRAARLVSQLLLFSRRQIMRPETLSLNETTADLMKMLGRIIGEHVQIRWHPASHLSYVFADRSMIEQALTNLCVNARDAMPEGGIVTIETREVTLSAQDCASNPEAQPGDYVLLSVSDTGCGMGEETLNHIFEPFFTTKAVGKGTGLGLATVYGIVKQHNGVIDVQSQPGKGSTFNLYWPVQPEGQRTLAIDVVEEPVAGGTETILLAEDDEAVRVMVRQILESAGYTVVTAIDGADALAVLKDFPGQVDLAILDVVMPNMGGHEAYQRMQAEYPGIKAFFASGYSEDAIHKNFVLDEGLTLIQKPYTHRDLLKTIREVLNRN